MFKIINSHSLLIFVISLSFLMEAVDGTIINTSIPAISYSLSVDPVNLKIALISYFLSLAIFIPISGWLADKFGSKHIFITALCVFTLGSLWCGFAHNLTWLVIARFVQGIGGALGLPVGRLIIFRTFGKERLIPMMNRIITFAALGMMLGPIIGGFITHHFSWHWIFWVNVPLGCMAIVLAHFCIQDNERHAAPAIDYLGFVLFGAGLGSFTFGLSALSETRFSSSIGLGIITLSFLMLMAYTQHSKHRRHPIVKVELLKLRTFKVSVIGHLISRLGFGGIPFLLPLLLQIGLGYPAEQSGMLLAPTAIGVMLSKPLYLPLLRIHGYKRLLIANTFLVGLSIWTFIIINATTPIYLISFLTFFYGFVIALQYGLMNSLAYADIAPENLSAASSILGTIQQISQSFSVAVSALLIRFFSFFYSDNVTHCPIIFQSTFFTIGLITLISCVFYTQLKPGDGQQMIVT
jgi:EmrB/QacA subfamily drug resistance transporter